MDDRHAQSLQEQAIESLSQLRAWIWAQHETLLPDDLSGVTREQAAHYAAYLEWYTTVDIALQALEVAAPSFGEVGCAVASAEMPADVPADGPEELRAELLEELPARTREAASPPPTARAPRPTSRSGVWHRTIAVSAPASGDSGARDSERIEARQSAA